MTRQIVIGLVFCAVVASRQPASELPFAVTEGTFFAVSVQDLDASIRWYTEKFGLTLNARLASGDVSVALLSGHGLDVELLSHRDSVARPFPFDMEAASDTSVVSRMEIAPALLALTSSTRSDRRTTEMASIIGDPCTG
jgi:hypothetical protein